MVSGVGDDDVRDESVAIAVAVDDANSDDDFDPVADQAVTATVTDDDTAGVTLSATTGDHGARPPATPSPLSSTPNRPPTS